MERIYRKRNNHSLTALVLLLLIVTTACHKNPADGTSPVNTIVLNDITVLVIEDSPYTFQSTVFVDIDKYPDRKGMMPDGKFDAVTRSYLVKTGDRTVLIDSGWGKEVGIDGRTQEILKAHGVQPDAVTDILLTHMDIDHISGLIHQGKAVYPHARLHIARDEYETWIIRGADRMAEHIDLARRVVTVYAGRTVLFDYGHTVAPGIVAQRANGHTAGHTMYDIDSGNKGMTIVGDMLHVAPVQLRHPDYCTIYDANPAIAAQTREQVLSRLSKSKRLIAGMHFVDIGQVRRVPEGGFVILP